jgi:hypothetical protein
MVEVNSSSQVIGETRAGTGYFDVIQYTLAFLLTSLNVLWNRQ